MCGAALFNIEPHRFEDARLSFFDGFSKSIYPRKILAVGPIFAAFAFNGDRVGVHIHAHILS